MPFDLQRLEVAPLCRAADVRGSVADILLPPPDIDVAEAAELYRGLHNTQGYSGPWRHAMSPWLVTPMQSLTSMIYETTCFVAPAQCGKTEIGLNFAVHSVRVDPADFQIVLAEKQQAEDFSERRLGRMIEHSPEISGRLRAQSKFMAVFEQSIVNLSWPTSANAASKPVPRNWLDERDSMADDIDGEGDPVALFHTRSKTFGPRRKTLVTSSPKRSKVKGAPKPTGAHEMPATKGVVALYNSGTRRWYYWPCVHCGGFFVTRLQDLQYPEGATHEDERIPVMFCCPHCGGAHEEEHRPAMLARAVWLAEGESIEADGTVTGTPRLTKTDSYWLFGPQTTFVSLEDLVRKKLAAEAERQKTGSDTELRTFSNVDAGEIYESDQDQAALSPDDLRAAAIDIPPGHVPAWAPLLIASVDVQSDRFEILWTAAGKGDEAAIVDHTRIVAVRPDGSPVMTGRGAGGAESMDGLEACDPAGSAHHWRALVDAVFDRVLPIEGDANRGLRPVVVAIDTGGKEGTTGKAYAFARWLRRNRPDLHKRAMFLKGSAADNPVRVWRAQWDPRTAENRPGGKKSKAPLSRRGVDLWLLASDLLKDSVANALRKAIKAKGKRVDGALHVARHLPVAVFEQLCAESRDEDGQWQNERRVANEAWDLAVYCHAAWIKLGGERIDWERPPSFASIRAAIEIAPDAPSTATPTPLPQRRRVSMFRFGGGL